MALELDIRPAEVVDVEPGWDSAFLVDGLSALDRVWFAFADDVMVGGVKVTCAPGPTARDILPAHVVVDSLSVEARCRGRGYGRVLMLFVHDWVARSTDLPNAVGLGVSEDNVAAIGLYESLGYRRAMGSVGQAIYTSGGALVMWLELPSPEGSFARVDVDDPGRNVTQDLG